VTDVAAWLNKHAHPDTTQIVVDDDEISAVLDVRHPKSHEVTGALSVHPSWAPWRQVLGRRLNQRQAHRLLRFAGEAELDASGVKLRSQVGSLTAVTGGEVKATYDARGLATVQSGTSTRAVTEELPATIAVSVPLFVGVLLREDGDTLVEPAYRLELELTVEVVDHEVMFTFECPRLEIAMLRAREDVATCLRQQLDDRAWLVGLGSVEVEQHLSMGDLVPCALASDPTRRSQTRPDWMVDQVSESRPQHAPYPAPSFMQPPVYDGPPLDTPTHDDGNCGPAEVGHDGPPPGETGIADVTDHS
jgi:hypothetical protein